MSHLQEQNQHIQTLLKEAPEQAGVYRYIQAGGNILYIGKAKNLRNRLRSYFQYNEKQELIPEPNMSYAKQLMISQIVDIQYTVVHNELEALFLEHTLIKQHQPPYNVNLKDDKNYLYIKISKSEAFPKIELVRNIKDKDAEYFGPYGSAQSIRHTLKMLRKIFPYRSCNRDFTKIPNGKVCLLYHLKLCAGPCEGKQNEIDYQTSLQGIKNFLRGKHDILLKNLQAKMQNASQNEAYEEAARFRDQIQNIQKSFNFKEQVSIRTQLDDMDIFGIFCDAGTAVISALTVRDGKITASQNFLLKNRLDENETEVFNQFLPSYYQGRQNDAKEILLPVSLDMDLSSLNEFVEGKKIQTLHIPQKGDKKKLLDIATQNAKEELKRHRLFFEEKEKIAEEGSLRLQKALKISHPLTRIECYDISHNQGKHSFGSMVVFINGKPDNSQYRIFKIASVEGNNDFESLKEVLTRRFVRLQNNDEKFSQPDLIIIDGGKGQLSSVMKIVHELNIKNIPIVSLAKQEEEIFFPGRSQSLLLPRNSYELSLVQQIRDEAHRFAIKHYRLRHKKSLSHSLLDDIPGIGPKTKQKLMKQFGSLEAIRNAKDEELSQFLNDTQKKNIQELL